MNWWRIEKAAGEGSERGSTGMLMEEPACDEACGTRGSVAQCEAKTKEWTGKIRMCSFPEADLEPDTASTCVGLCCELPAGTEIAEGNCERGMEVGMWDLGRLEMPASIWLALDLRPRRMYSTGTLASSGAAATIESRDTSAKEGRARLRGS